MTERTEIKVEVLNVQVLEIEKPKKMGQWG
jgi:hypothetical protein